MNLRKLLSKDNIFLDLKSNTKEGVIEEIIDRLVASGKIKDRNAALKAILERERKMSTGMENGIALPHGKNNSVDKLITAIAVKKEEKGCQIKLEFPSIHIASFICSRILQAFRNEEFFVHRLNIEGQIYHIKKEDIFITLIQRDKTIELNTSTENKHLVSLIVLEEILELKELLEAVHKLKSPEYLYTELATGLFSEDEE